MVASVAAVNRPCRNHDVCNAEQVVNVQGPDSDVSAGGDVGAMASKAARWAQSTGQGRYRVCRVPWASCSSLRPLRARSLPSALRLRVRPPSSVGFRPVRAETALT